MSRPSPGRVASRWMREAKIKHPPRELGKYLKILDRKLSGAVKTLDKALDTLLKSSVEEDMAYWLKETSDYEVDYYDLETMRGYQKKLQEYVQKTKDDLGFIERSDNAQDRRRGLDWLHSSTKYTIEDLERWDRLQRGLSQKQDQMIRGFTEHGYDEYLPRRVLEALKVLAPTMKSVDRILADADEKLGELLEMTRRRWHTEDPYKPEHENVETLYHATTEARELMRSGFRSGEHFSGIGLGGGGGLAEGQAGLSFTSDLWIAKEIMRVFKETKMIADGKVKAVDIMDWARRSNIADQVAEMYTSLRGGTWKDAQSPGAVFALYEVYLAYADRYNPVFYRGDKEKFMRKFKGVKKNDIGVLVADVDMTNPDIMYFAAEREFRIPPEAIIDIKKVIK